MRSSLVTLAVLALLLTACGEDADVLGDEAASGSGSADAPEPSAPAPTTAPTKDAPLTPSAPASSAAPDPALALDSVVADVSEIAPALESFYRGAPYPTSLDEVLASLPDAGLTLEQGNTLATYSYDPETVEFAICIESDSGAWARYDTAPMSVRESGETGGCPPA